MLISPGKETPLEKTVMMIKGGSSFRIRKELTYKFPNWHGGYHDRWIRNVAEYRIRKQYIELNPVKAQLVENAVDYVAGSATGKYQLDACQFDGGSFRD
jgi:putative transposase